MIKIMLESIGARVRLTLSPGQGEVAANMFANLLWIMGFEGTAESPVMARDRLASGVKAFRCANVTQGRRGKGLWKQSPFSFSCVAQRNDTRDIAGAGDYQTGNADYSSATDSEFSGFKSRLETAE